MATAIGKTKAQARSEAEEIVNTWTAGAVLTGWIPGSTLFLGLGDMVMVRQVADAFGVGVFDEDAVKAHLNGIARSIVGGVAAELAGLVPFVGTAAKTAFLAGKAKLIGQAVIDYFEEQSGL